MLSFVVVVIGFEPVSYSVDEGRTVNVIVKVLSGTLRTAVTVLVTGSGSGDSLSFSLSPPLPLLACLSACLPRSLLSYSFLHHSPFSLVNWSGFQQVNRNITFSDTKMMEMIAIVTTDDNDVEDDKQVMVTLSSTDPLVMLVNDTATVTIKNDGKWARSSVGHCVHVPSVG